MPALAIPVHDLDSSGKDFVFALDEAWLREAFRDTGVRADREREGSVEVHAQLNGREVLVHGRAHAWLLAECVRCLKDLPLEVSCELAALYAPGEAGVQSHHGGRERNEVEARAGARERNEEELELDADAPDRESYTGDQVLIDDLVRDSLLLELPMQPRCDLGWDCPNLDLPPHMRSPSGVQSGGTGEHFGEGAIDPRLKPLQKLARREPEAKARAGARERNQAEARAGARERNAAEARADARERKEDKE